MRYDMIPREPAASDHDYDMIPREPAASEHDYVDVQSLPGVMT